MGALCWHGKHDIRYDTVPDPVIEDGRDAIVKVSTCAICGSDLHLFDGFMPSMEKSMADKVFGHATAGLFGYSYLTGGYAGGTSGVCPRTVRR